MNPCSREWIKNWREAMNDVALVINEMADNIQRGLDEMNSSESYVIGDPGKVYDGPDSYFTAEPHRLPTKQNDCPEWTRVEDGLPKTDAASDGTAFEWSIVVLVWGRGMSRAREGVYYFRDGSWGISHWDEYDGPHPTITHWQLLPDPPEVKE